MESFTPDLMLLDLSMPLMNGFEVLSRLRDSPRLSALPVVVVTGETSARLRDKGQGSGGSRRLEKVTVHDGRASHVDPAKLPALGANQPIELRADKADTCIMWTNSGNGGLCELVTFADGTIGVTRNKTRIVSRRFTTDQFEECIDLLYNVSGRGLSASRKARGATLA